MGSYFLLTLNLLALCHSVLSCSSHNAPIKRPVKRFIEDSAKHYTFTAPLNRFCDDKRSDFRFYKVPNDIDTSECISIVPGLSKLSRGVTRYHFRSNANDKPPMHSQIFQYTCYDSINYSTRKFENHTVPTEISIIESQPVTTHQQYTLSTTSLLNSFLDDIELIKAQNQYIPYLAPFNITEIKNFKGAGYFSVKVEHYFIRLSTNIQPKLLLQEDFNALPLTLENNIFEYYNFLRKYGSHAIMEAVMGAQMFALHLHSSTDETKKYSKIFKTSDDLVKEVESLRAGDSSRLTIMTVGGTAHNNDLNTWMSTIKNQPVPLTMEYIPLHDFMEKNEKTVKSHFFQKMIKFEKDEFELKRLIFELNVIRKNNVLGEFLKTNLILELDFVCISNDLMTLLSNGVTKTKNIKLNRFGINCTLQWPEGPEDWHVERQYNLIPNVCLTLSILTTNGCNSLTYSFPDKIKCFVFYEQSDCNPEARKHIVRNKHQINQTFPITKSMRFCQINEG